MPTAQPAVNDERLWNNLMELGRIGVGQGGGLWRPGLSRADLEAKAWFREKLEQAGLETVEDSVLNQIGRLAGPKGSKPLAVGSHLDTVPGGGRFDGALGVLAGLECARSIMEQGVELNHGLEVINFTDEEGAHGLGTVGSRVMLGQLGGEELEPCGFAGGLAAAGGDPDSIGSDARKPEEFAGYLELHIEQGAVLEQAGERIGAVTGIVGIRRYLVTVSGQSGHAGTTPMHMRKDALVEAAPFVTLLPKWVREQNPLMVGTIGQLSLVPGAANVIPGVCSFIVELRSPEQKDLDLVGKRLVDFSARRPAWQAEMIYDTEPAALSEDIIRLIEQAAEGNRLAHRRMPSGAGHDAHSFAAAGVPSGMVFIPCEKGLSHCAEENIGKEQAADGCRILLEVLLALDRA